MQKLLTTRTASLTDLRDPMKVIEAAGDQVVAILNRNNVIGYFVPESLAGKNEYEYASADEVTKIVTEHKKKMQPVLDYLKDK